MLWVLHVNTILQRVELGSPRLVLLLDKTIANIWEASTLQVSGGTVPVHNYYKQQGYAGPLWEQVNVVEHHNFLLCRFNSTGDECIAELKWACDLFVSHQHAEY
jgi:hypothetical protein